MLNGKTACPTLKVLYFQIKAFFMLNYGRFRESSGVYDYVAVTAFILTTGKCVLFLFMYDYKVVL